MAAEGSSETLSNLLHEERRFPPTEEFVAQANAQPSLYEDAARTGWTSGTSRPSGSTGPSRGRQALDWSNAPFAKWFVGGRLNVAVNCVDRHVAAGHGDQVAIHFEGEPGDTRDDHLRRPAARGVQGRERADRARRPGRRPGRRSTCR